MEKRNKEETIIQREEADCTDWEEMHVNKEITELINSLIHKYKSALKRLAD